MFMLCIFFFFFIISYKLITHNLTLSLPAAPCARPVCIDEDKNRPIPPYESGTACSQYYQQIKYEEWNDRKIVALIDYASPNIPITKLRLYIDDKDVENDEHYDVKDSCAYKMKKFCIWLIIVGVAIAIIAITQVSSNSNNNLVGPVLIVFVIVVVALASWLWNCWICGKCGKAKLEIKVDEFVGYSKKSIKDEKE